MKKNILSWLVGLAVGCPLGILAIAIIVKINNLCPSISIGKMCTYLLVVLFGLLFLLGTDILRDVESKHTNIIDVEE